MNNFWVSSKTQEHDYVKIFLWIATNLSIPCGTGNRSHTMYSGFRGFVLCPKKLILKENKTIFRKQFYFIKI